MSEINRSLIILKPKQPFIDWARTLDDEDKNLTLKELSEDSRLPCSGGLGLLRTAGVARIVL
ncbi:MAG TPA: hypothetical protein VJ180_15375 [Pyrinomonadaceae bacterium]|nr:hypothetical protein [Pyrinomonadaceae bacterium]